MGSVGKVEAIIQIEYIDTIHLFSKNFNYTFEGDKITVTYDGVADVFDFTDMPEGAAVVFFQAETILKYNPIVSAKRIDGILHLTLLNFVPRRDSNG